MSRVNLEAFVANVRAEIRNFEEMWRLNRVENPKDWPATQPSLEEWHEQFNAWLEDSERTRPEVKP